MKEGRGEESGGGEWGERERIEDIRFGDSVLAAVLVEEISDALHVSIRLVH